MAKGEPAEHAGAAYFSLCTDGCHTAFVPETGKCLPLRPDLPVGHRVTSRQKISAASAPLAWLWGEGPSRCGAIRDWAHSGPNSHLQSSGVGVSATPRATAPGAEATVHLALRAVSFGEGATPGMIAELYEAGRPAKGRRAAGRKDYATCIAATISGKVPIKAIGLGGPDIVATSRIWTPDGEEHGKCGGNVQASHHSGFVLRRIGEAS